MKKVLGKVGSFFNLKTQSGRSILLTLCILLLIVCTLFGNVGFSTYNERVSVTGLDLILRLIGRTVGNTDGIKTNYVFSSLFVLIAYIMLASLLVFVVYGIIVAVRALMKKRNAPPFPLLILGLPTIIVAALSLYCQLDYGSELTGLLTGYVRFETGIVLVLIPIIEFALFFGLYLSEYGLSVLTEVVDEKGQPSTNNMALDDEQSKLNEEKVETDKVEEKKFDSDIKNTESVVIESTGKGVSKKVEDKVNAKPYTKSKGNHRYKK